MIIWIFGQPCSGKTTIANELLEYYHEKGKEPIIIDGDEFRKVFNDANYGKDARMRNIERASIVAKFLESKGHLVICSFVTPYKSMRYGIKDLCGEVKFVYLTYEGKRGRENFHVVDFEPPIEGEEDFLNLNTSRMGIKEALRILKLKLYDK